MTYPIYKIIAAAFAALVLSNTASHSLGCEVDPAKFDFTSDSPVTFNLGTKNDVDNAYQALVTALEPLDSYKRTHVFYAKGFETIWAHTCEEEKCSTVDVLEGLQNCGARGMNKKDVCYPLAVVYQQRLYCLLFPGQADFDPSKPFLPYVPFQNGKVER